MNRAELIQVFKDTERTVNQGYYYVNREEVKVKYLNSMRKGTRLYQTLDKIAEDDRPYFESPKIYVQNIDTFDKAIEFGPKAACLNMASYRIPGGGVRKGSSAQEESLCRRSSLLASLERIGYPLPFEGGIYSPSVCIIKDKNYNYLEIPVKTNVISVAAISHPKLDKEGHILKSYARMTRTKIRAILRIAIRNGHTKLVLGAFGCGAYANPASDMAELFRRVLSEEEFANSFEEICFAIIEDNNSVREENKEGNLVPFINVFGQRE